MAAALPISCWGSSGWIAQDNHYREVWSSGKLLLTSLQIQNGPWIKWEGHSEEVQHTWQIPGNKQKQGSRGLIENVQLLCKGFFFLGASSPGLSRPGFTRLMKDVGFFPSVTENSAKDKPEGQATVLLLKRCFPKLSISLFPSHVCALSHSILPDPSSWGGIWNLVPPSSAYLDMVFPMLQEVSLIIPKVKQKYLCKTPWILPPSSFCFILFLVIIKQSIFYFHFFLWRVETTCSDYIYMSSRYYRKLFYHCASLIWN